MTLRKSSTASCLISARNRKEANSESNTLICVGAAGMIGSVLFASNLSSGWVLFWGFFAAVLGFGIGVRGKA